jgi:hypothetical protein
MRYRIILSRLEALIAPTRASDRRVDVAAILIIGLIAGLYSIYSLTNSGVRRVLGGKDLRRREFAIWAFRAQYFSSLNIAFCAKARVR